MLFLTSEGDLLRVITSSAATLDVHASFAEIDGTAVTLQRTNTPISSATTTTIVAAPSGTAKRTVKTLAIFNRHASLDCTVTVVHTDGTNAMQLEQVNIGPGGVLHYIEGSGFSYQSSLAVGGANYLGVVAGLLGNADPNRTFFEMQRAGNIAATPTNISVSVARCSLFRLPVGLTLNRIRYYGVGATTNVYRVAIYRYSDLARLTTELAFSTTANTWGSVDAGGVALSANTLYFAAVAVNATGTTPGPSCIGTTTAATTGQIQSTPAALPGSLSAGSGYIDNYNFQFAVTTGALPATAATLALAAAWTGGFPALFLDSNAAA